MQAEAVTRAVRFCASLAAFMPLLLLGKSQGNTKKVQANTAVTSVQLEANRNHQMSWPQYRREKD
jgi:hypothetical protein